MQSAQSAAAKATKIATAATAAAASPAASPATPTVAPSQTEGVAAKITPPKRTLWDIDADLSALDDLLEDAEGDITACEATVDAWFAELRGDLNRKVDGYAGYIAELNARSEARKEEADRLAHRARIDASLRDYLKGRLKEYMQSRVLTKLETARYKLTVAGNGGKLPVILSDAAKREPEKLPEQFRKVAYSPNTDAIREELETGGKLEFAVLGERGTHLRIS